MTHGLVHSTCLLGTLLSMCAEGYEARHAIILILSRRRLLFHCKWRGGYGERNRGRHGHWYRTWSWRNWGRNRNGSRYADWSFG